MKCPKESTLEDVKRKDGENNEKAMELYMKAIHVLIIVYPNR